MKAAKMDVGVSFLECKELKILRLGWLIKNPILFCQGSLQTSAGSLPSPPQKGGRNLSLLE